MVKHRQLRLMVNISSRQRPMLNLLQSLVLTSNQPTSNICLHSNLLGYHMFGLPWPRLKPPSPVSIAWNCTTGIAGKGSLLLYWYIGPLGLNLDRLARFGLPRSSIETWVDSPWVFELCKLWVTKYDQIRSKDRTIFEARPNLVWTCNQMEGQPYKHHRGCFSSRKFKLFPNSTMPRPNSSPLLMGSKVGVQGLEDLPWKISRFYHDDLSWFLTNLISQER